MAETTLPQHYRRNFWCLVSDFGFFGVAATFISPSTIVPSFLSVLGASTVAIGLVSSLQTAGGLVPQLFAARYLSGKPYRKPYILWPSAISRSLYPALALVLWATGGRPAWLITALTAFVITAFWTGNALASVPWFDLIGKVIPVQRRGRMFGLSQALSGILGFLAGAVVEWMLGDRGPGFPTNYAVLFLLGFAMLALSFAAVAMMVEEHRTPAARVPAWRQYLPQLWRVLQRDRPFRRYIIARQLFALEGLATPFYITFALRQLGLPAQVVGRYTSIGVAGRILASLAFGWLSERSGSRRVVQASVGLAVVSPLLALAVPQLAAAPGALAWTYGLVFLSLSAVTSSTMTGWMSYVLEWAPEAKRPLYVALTNTLGGLAGAASSIGGLILQWTDNDYRALFVLAAIGPLLALPLIRRLPATSPPEATAQEPHA